MPRPTRRETIAVDSAQDPDLFRAVVDATCAIAEHLGVPSKDLFELTLGTTSEGGTVVATVTRLDKG